MQIAATIQNSILLQVNTHKKKIVPSSCASLLNEKFVYKGRENERKKKGFFFQNWSNNFSVMYSNIYSIKNMNDNNDFRKSIDFDSKNTKKNP